MATASTLAKNIFKLFGISVSRTDRLYESIPANYEKSPFLPKVYRNNIDRILFFEEMIDSIKDVDGDIVECGVSIGHGALVFLLLGEHVGHMRTYYGFDSFEGFPPAKAEDGATPISGPGYYANPPETVLRVLRDGHIPEDWITQHVRLVRGFFDKTLPDYQGKIALLHLDCDLYESYKLSLETLYSKISPGGLIIFDEYNDPRWEGAKKAVDEFFSDKPETVQLWHGRKDRYFVRLGNN